jgi:hypothetical protein
MEATTADAPMMRRLRPIREPRAKPRPKVKHTMTYRDSVLASGPVGYWPLDENTGTCAYDVSGGSYHGQYHGDPSFGTQGPFGASRATLFNGVDQYVEIANPDVAAFSQPTSGEGLSIECWMRSDQLLLATETTQYVHWLGKGENGAQEWAFRLYSASDPQRPNRISCYCFNPSGAGGVDLGAGAHSQELLVGAWTYIVGTLDPGDPSDPLAGVTVFRDGERIEGADDSPGARYGNQPHWAILPVAGSSPVRIATRDRRTFFAGAIAQVAIYPRVLSEDDVQAHYAAARAEGLA